MFQHQVQSRQSGGGVTERFSLNDTGGQGNVVHALGS